MTIDRGTLETSSIWDFSRKELLGASLAFSAFLILYYISGYFIGQLYMGCYDATESWFCRTILDDVISERLLFNLLEPLILGFVSASIARIGVKTADQNSVFAVFSAGLALFLLGERGFYYFYEDYWIVDFQSIALSLIYFLMVAVGAFCASRLGRQHAPMAGDSPVAGKRLRLGVGYIVSVLLVLHTLFFFCAMRFLEDGGDWFYIPLGLWFLVALAGVVLLHRARREGEPSGGFRVLALVVAYGLLMVPTVIAAFLAFIVAMYGGW